MPLLQPFRSLTSTQRRAFTACFLGWTLDAFDFFILTYCLDSVASAYHVNLETVAYSLTWTLCMRPVGALLFGLLAERFGRRPTLMLNIICFSVFEVASAFAPTFHIFLITRALFRIAAVFMILALTLLVILVWAPISLQMMPRLWLSGILQLLMLAQKVSSSLSHPHLIQQQARFR